MQSIPRTLIGDLPGYTNKPAPTYRTSTIPPRYTREPDTESVRDVSSRPRGRPRKPEPAPQAPPRCAGPDCIAPATQGHGFVCTRHWYQLDKFRRVDLLTATGKRKHKVRQFAAGALR